MYLILHNKIFLQLGLHVLMDFICDRILENRSNCLTGPVPFFGPANGYTYTLHIHSAIIRFG